MLDKVLRKIVESCDVLQASYGVSVRLLALVDLKLSMLRGKRKRNLTKPIGGELGQPNQHLRSTRRITSFRDFPPPPKTKLRSGVCGGQIFPHVRRSNVSSTLYVGGKGAGLKLSIAGCGSIANIPVFARWLKRASLR